MNQPATPASSARELRLGIQRTYLDSSDQPARLDDATVETIAAAIGEPTLAQRADGPVVVRVGGSIDIGSAATLSVTCEDGGECDLDLSAPVTLPAGYHWLHTDQGPRRLIVSPGQCPRIEERAWGWATQLYATRSRASWGIGDLADLRQLTTLARAQGAGFVLVNPLHAGGSTSLELAQPSSPYCPSSRQFFSPLYIAVADVAGAPEALGSKLAAFTELARGISSGRAIDRDAIWKIKRAALREVFDLTNAVPTPEFSAWRESKGAALAHFATWSILSERYGGNWRHWPEGARRPDGPLTRQLTATDREDVAFVAWLQWQAELQLRAAAQTLRVVQDLPIGVDPNGADAWVHQDLCTDAATIGSPPDPFNRTGQDWGLLPFIPWRLRAANYEPFIQSIRATMALAGGLRIDHVMGLFRLWWVPRGSSPDRGGYVRYPDSDLLDILALESQRAGAPVIGEDLGTVEPGVREELARRNVLSYRLSWFEADPPSTWPVNAMAAVSTHDLPTVAGVWDGSDLLEQKACGVDADANATEQLRERIIADVDVGERETMTAADAVLAAYQRMGQAPSTLLVASLEDALVESLRPNMPGTRQRQNWCTALDVWLDDFDTEPSVANLAGVLRAAIAADRTPPPA